ncbi:hypothetical protein D9756_004959 [Leucocoprinus leucothites]|uniref:Uncharacterized protein n=1 Tax=Leucocoprinus leucothites TaxID=201217 RepID=A0A8H5LKG3_9AGAR|nr:hypothetical protein D9756_004959 [Leucoagaricus leucothites]
MALTQSARLPGPSWDEEVVPALRKRLEDESRTLARRMSAISIASLADDSPLNAFNSNSAVDPVSISSFQNNNYNHNNGINGASSASGSSTGHRTRPGYQSHQPTTPAHQHSASVASTSVHPRAINGTRKPPPTNSFHRSRTYSQPYANIGGGIRQPRRTNTTNLVDHTNFASRSPRLVDAKPTRIPKASRGPPGSIMNASSPATPILNGPSSGVSHSTTPTPTQTPNPNSGYSADIKAYHFPTSHSAQGISQHTTARLINEPAPFNTASSSSSIYNIHEERSTDELGYNVPQPSRDSLDSTEETPFEHWYRGEISRNGGVGELRVGRRQEMLDIANYGHAMHNKRKLLASRQAALLALEDSRRGSLRKRADSVAGFGRLGPSMRERGSLYLEDDAILDRIERVLDEDPLTDLDGEEASDIASISTKGQQDQRPYRYSNHDTDFLPGVGDITVTTAVADGYSDLVLPSSQSPPTTYRVEESKVETPKQQFTTPTQPSLPITSITTPTQPSALADASITTPIQHPPPPARSPTPRSKSRQGSSSSRIPTYERRSSESRTSTPSQHSSNTTKVGHPMHVVDLTSVSPTPSPSPPLPSITPVASPTGRAATTPSTPTSASKRGISPGPHNTPGSTAKKPRTPGPTTPGKTRPKPKPTAKKFVKEEDNRKSVAYYPTPGGEGEDVDMSNAIPYWTQPKVVGGDGNWDDVRALFRCFFLCALLRFAPTLVFVMFLFVVLPVVARKRGLDNHYEKADGSPQPKKKQVAPIAPAPGTFGYDGTKIRRRGEDIEMDEFGRPQPGTNQTPDVLEEVEPSKLLEEPTAEEGEGLNTEVSVAHDNIRVPVKPPPSPAPFAHYAPTTTKHLTQPIVLSVARNEEQQVAVEQDEKGAGCCKCVVM